MTHTQLILNLIEHRYFEIDDETFNVLFPEPDRRVYYLLKTYENKLSQEDQLNEFLVKHDIEYQGPSFDNRNHKFRVSNVNQLKFIFLSPKDKMDIRLEEMRKSYTPIEFQKNILGGFTCEQINQANEKISRIIKKSSPFYKE